MIHELTKALQSHPAELCGLGDCWPNLQLLDPASLVRMVAPIQLSYRSRSGFGVDSINHRHLPCYHAPQCDCSSVVGKHRAIRNGCQYKVLQRSTYVEFR